MGKMRENTSHHLLQKCSNILYIELLLHSKIKYYALTLKTTITSNFEYAHACRLFRERGIEKVIRKPLLLLSIGFYFTNTGE